MLQLKFKTNFFQKNSQMIAGKKKKKSDNFLAYKF